MTTQQEQVQQKREVDKAQESTMPMRAFLPPTDIFETEDAPHVSSRNAGSSARQRRSEC